MNNNRIALLASTMTMFAVTLFGVLWFRPIAEADAAGAPLLLPSLNLLIYSVLSIGLFGGVVRCTKRHYMAAFVIGASQYILVIDLTCEASAASLPPEPPRC